MDSILRKTGIQDEDCREKLLRLIPDQKVPVSSQIAEILTEYSSSFPASAVRNLDHILFGKCTIPVNESFDIWHRRNLQDLAGMHLKKVRRLQKEDSDFDGECLLEAQLSFMKESGILGIVNTGILFPYDFNSDLLNQAKAPD